MSQHGLRRWPPRLPAVIFRCLLTEVSEPSEDCGTESCQRMACVSSRNVFDVEQCTTPSGLASVTDWQGISVPLHSALQRPLKHPPIRPLTLFLCFVDKRWIFGKIKACEGTATALKRDKWMSAVWRPLARLITAVSYQRTLICQPHTPYSSLCFPPSRSIT